MNFCAAWSSQPFWLLCKVVPEKSARGKTYLNLFFFLCVQMRCGPSKTPRCTPISSPYVPHVSQGPPVTWRCLRFWGTGRLEEISYGVDSRFPWFTSCSREMRFQNTPRFCFLLGDLLEHTLLCGIGTLALGLELCMGTTWGHQRAGLELMLESGLSFPEAPQAWEHMPSQSEARWGDTRCQAEGEESLGTFCDFAMS